jgi:hypothetical protein
MQIDPQYLRRQYSSLSDDALLAIDRSELVEIAQQQLDAEIDSRGLSQRRRSKRSEEAPSARRPSVDAAPEDDAAQYEDGEQYAEDEPDWLEDAAEVYSRLDVPGRAPSADLVDARDALEAAAIPCYFELTEVGEEAPVSSTHRWRLLVPGQLNLQATSILERDIFNHGFEADWKAHLQTLSDTELDAMKPETAFCGLFDRIERVTRAYDQEIARRKLRSESA